jgi:hypothetical protein
MIAHFLVPLLVACGSDPATPVTPAVPPPAAEAPSAHDATPHTHASPHGGISHALGDIHAEAVISPDGILFYLADVDDKPLMADGWTGTAVTKSGNEVQTVELMPMGDHLHAMVKLTKGAPASVVLTVTKDGKARSGTFETPSVGMAAHDHTALHGGQVSMWGDHHVEYLGSGDTYQAWVTDAHRNPVREGVSGSLTDGTTVVPLRFDPATGLLSGKGAGAGTRPVSIDVSIGATKFTLAFNAGAFNASAAPTP